MDKSADHRDRSMSWSYACLLLLAVIAIIFIIYRAGGASKMPFVSEFDASYADMNGPMYNTTNDADPTDAARSLIMRYKAGHESTLMEMVVQPGYGESVVSGDDPGGVVLWRLMWPDGYLEKTDWNKALPAEILDNAKITVTSGNGIQSIDYYCNTLNGEKVSQKFCAHATLAARLYLYESRAQNRYVVIRQNGEDSSVAPENVH